MRGDVDRLVLRPLDLHGGAQVREVRTWLLPGLCAGRERRQRGAEELFAGQAFHL